MSEPDPERPLGLPQFRGDNVPPPKAGHQSLPVVGDIALAVGLLVLDAIGTVVAFLIGIDYSDWQPFDAGADHSDIHLTSSWLYVGIAGGVILLTAVLLYRLRAVVSTCLQVLVAVVVVLLAVAGAQFDEEHGARADASVPGHTAASHH
ncbi:MAG: hypothetical protein HOY79_13985 [Streptomyces sp.]|nr:hypothetical protein [Streptomyces sp.]